MEQKRCRQGRQELHHHVIQQVRSRRRLPSVSVLNSHPATETSPRATTAMCDHVLQPFFGLIYGQDATHSFVASPEIVTVSRRRRISP